MKSTWVIWTCASVEGRKLQEMSSHLCEKRSNVTNVFHFDCWPTKREGSEISPCRNFAIMQIHTKLKGFPTLISTQEKQWLILALFLIAICNVSAWKWKRSMNSLTASNQDPYSPSIIIIITLYSHNNYYLLGTSSLGNDVFLPEMKLTMVFQLLREIHWDQPFYYWHR